MPIPVIAALVVGGIGGFVTAKGTDALADVLKAAGALAVGYVVWKELK